jgi:MFS family permease
MDVLRAHSSRTALAVLAIATAVGSLGLAAGGTAGALVATAMTGSTASAGLPLGVLVAGSAAGAALISRRTQRAGRLRGLMLGYALGTAGAVVVIVGMVVSSFGLVLAGSAALGAANAAVFLGRYAAVDMSGSAARGRALGIVLAAAAVGAVVSPNLLGPSGRLATELGIPRLAGLYLVAVVSFGTAGVLLAALPDRSVGGRTGRPGSAAGAGIRDAVRTRRGGLPLVVLAMANLVMVATMAVAPVHMTARGQDLDRIGIVVGVHVLGMFALSPLTGWFADRIGGAAVAAVGAILLILAGLGGAAADMYGGLAFVAALALLGIGWNASVVGGSTMLVASIPPHMRPQAEGMGEVAMGLAAGAGAPIAGLVVAVGGFPTLAVSGAAMSAIALGILRKPRQPPGDDHARQRAVTIPEPAPLTTPIGGAWPANDQPVLGP